jgi:hypothetical protein
MVDFIVAGGFPAIIILVLGAVSIVTAALFFRAADPGRLAVVRALNTAVMWAVVVGVAADLRSVASHVARDPEWMKEPLGPLLQGFAESLVPAVLGGTILSVSWILIGFGLRKMPASNHA